MVKGGGVVGSKSQKYFFLHFFIYKKFVLSFKNNDLKQKNCHVSEAAGVGYKKKIVKCKKYHWSVHHSAKPVGDNKFIKTDLSSCHSEASPDYEMNETICSHVQP